MTTGHVMSAASFGGVIVLIIGILIMGGEFRHGTVTSTFLISPKRGRVVGAKLVADPRWGGNRAFRRGEPRCERRTAVNVGGGRYTSQATA